MTPNLPPVLPPIGDELKFTKTHFQSNEIAGSIVKVTSHGACGRFFETTSNSYPTRNVIPLEGWTEGLEPVEPIARANGIGSPGELILKDGGFYKNRRGDVKGPITDAGEVFLSDEAVYLPNGHISGGLGNHVHDLIEEANGIGGESDLVKLAREIATVAHAGQFRRDGVTPYIEHPKAVAEALTGESDEVIAVAWLHDVLEYCSLDGGDLINKGLPYEVVRAVEDLTKLSVMSYETYIYQIGKNPVAKKVKIADILHNLSDSPTLNQIEKYTRALGVLGVVKEPTSDPCKSVVKESLTTESPKPDAPVVSHVLVTNSVESHESPNVSDKPTPPKPEGETPIIIMTSGGVSEYRSHPDLTPEYHGGFMSPERVQKLESDLAAARADLSESQTKIGIIKAKYDQLNAARLAYASEFEPDEEGNPNVGSIHENIRKLKQSEQRLRAALEWQPIETAPKDGTKITIWLNYPHNMPVMAGWTEEFECWIGDGGEDYPSDIATRWMPLPPAPASSGKGEG